MNNTIDLRSIQSHDTRPSAQMKKLNSEGQFLPFEGLTVIMPLVTDLSAMYHALRQVVPPEIHSLLSYESFHVTFTEIKCRSHFKNCEKYNEFLGEKLKDLEALKMELSNYQAKQSDLLLAFEMKHPVDASHMPQITVHLKPAHETTTLHLASIAECCQRHLGNKLFRPSRHHLSLAYRVPNSAELTPAQQTLIAQAINSHLEGKVLHFGRAQLCKFSDMCTFIPL